MNLGISIQDVFNKCKFMTYKTGNETFVMLKSNDAYNFLVSLRGRDWLKNKKIMVKF